MYQVKVEKFEGPLDLLLQLIEQADLDITEVSIAKVTDQFVAYLATVEEKNPEELADFLVIASKLLFLKSKVLLPNLDLGGEEEFGDLERQLKIYQEYLLASRQIESLLARHNFLFSREKIPLATEIIFNPPPQITASKLRQIFSEIIRNIEPFIHLPQRSLEKVISIKEKIEQIRQQIFSGLSRFSELIKNSKNKTEIIVTFLGLLELVKQRLITVEQKEKFQEITFQKYEES